MQAGQKCATRVTAQSLARHSLEKKCPKHADKIASSDFPVLLLSPGAGANVLAHLTIRPYIKKKKRSFCSSKKGESQWSFTNKYISSKKDGRKEKKEGRTKRARFFACFTAEAQRLVCFYFLLSSSTPSFFPPTTTPSRTAHVSHTSHPQRFSICRTSSVNFCPWSASHDEHNPSHVVVCLWLTL